MAPRYPYPSGLRALIQETRIADLQRAGDARNKKPALPESGVRVLVHEQTQQPRIDYSVPTARAMRSLCAHPRRLPVAYSVRDL